MAKASSRNSMDNLVIFSYLHANMVMGFGTLVRWIPHVISNLFALEMGRMGCWVSPTKRFGPVKIIRKIKYRIQNSIL